MGGTKGSAPQWLKLPESPSLDWLRKQAKRYLDDLRKANPSARLAEAQFELAKQYGFLSWRLLKAHIDSLTIDGQLFGAARNGDAETLTRLLDQYPEKLHARAQPYEWTLLHAAAHKGQLSAVDLLLKRGLDVNTREEGDNTYAMHWAAAAGHLDVVRRLAEAGGDVVGHGDDHELEVIGWATGWDGCDDAAHRAIADFLVSRGARHHIFSAIAVGDLDLIQKLVEENPEALDRRMSRFEQGQTPLHFAISRKRYDILDLLIELGADLEAEDRNGQTALAVAMLRGDREAMRRLRTAARCRCGSSRALRRTGSGAAATSGQRNGYGEHTTRNDYALQQKSAPGGQKPNASTCAGTLTCR